MLILLKFEETAEKESEGSPIMPMNIQNWCRVETFPTNDDMLQIKSLWSCKMEAEQEKNMR